MPPAGKSCSVLNGEASAENPDSVVKEKSRRRKSNKTATTGAEEDVSVETELVVAEDCGQDLPSISHGVTASCIDEVAKGMRELLNTYRVVLGIDGVMAFWKQSTDYDKILKRVLLENERLRGRMDVLMSSAYVARIPAAAVSAVAPVVPVVDSRAVSPAVSSAVNVAVPVVASCAVSDAVDCAVPPAVVSEDAANTVIPKVKKPVAWTVVARSKKSGASKKVQDKVDVADYSPAVEKVAENGKTIELSGKLGPRVVVNGVHSVISPDEFMTEIYLKNLKERMSFDVFRRNVHLVTASWKADPDRCVNVILEGDEKVMKEFLADGRIFVKWFSFRTRVQDAIPHCFRCLGFDHRIRECRMREDVCRLCGQSGHMAPQCCNPVSCRNCVFKGLPADHGMFDPCCPLYAALSARARAGR